MESIQEIDLLIEEIKKIEVIGINLSDIIISILIILVLIIIKERKRIISWYDRLK